MCSPEACPHQFKYSNALLMFSLVFCRLLNRFCVAAGRMDARLPACNTASYARVVHVRVRFCTDVNLDDVIFGHVDGTVSNTDTDDAERREDVDGRGRRGRRSRLTQATTTRCNEEALLTWTTTRKPVLCMRQTRRLSTNDTWPLRQSMAGDAGGRPSRVTEKRGQGRTGAEIF